jgi:hypothetical protein
MKLAEAHDVWLKWFTQLLQGSAANKKSARWGIKLLYEQMKKEQLRSREAITPIFTVDSF